MLKVLRLYCLCKEIGSYWMHVKMCLLNTHSLSVLRYLHFFIFLFNLIFMIACPKRISLFMKTTKEQLQRPVFFFFFCKMSIYRCAYDMFLLINILLFMSCYVPWDFTYQYVCSRIYVYIEEDLLTRVVSYYWLTILHK